MAGILKGYKTYLVAAAMIVYAGYGVYSGSMDSNTAVDTILQGLGLGALRHGVGR